MNFVFVGAKKQYKACLSAMKNSLHKVIGLETELRGSTAARIIDHHAPHGILLMQDVPIAKNGISVQEFLTLLHVRRPDLRVIYLSEGIPAKAELSNSIDMLLSYDIFEYYTSFLDMTERLDFPMTADEMRSLVSADEVEEVTEVDTEEETITYAKQIQQSFSNVSALDYDDTIIEHQQVQYGNPSAATPLLIGVAQLQHHNGCTHIAFELATVLWRRKLPVCVVIADNDTYHNLAVFYGISPSNLKNGLLVNGIPVYPFDSLREVQQTYAYVVCDFGYLRDDRVKAYDNATVRFMLCSGAEWDIATTSNYINYTPNARKIAYLFPRITRRKFIGYQKDILGSGCVAFRVHSSPDWFSPCAENRAIYSNILTPFLKAIPAESRDVEAQRKRREKALVAFKTD